jgi:hypothetical protein
VLRKQPWVRIPLSPPLKADTQNGWRFFDFESGIRSER